LKLAFKWLTDTVDTVSGMVTCRLVIRCWVLIYNLNPAKEKKLSTMKLSQVAINGDSLGLQAQVPLRPGPYFGGILL